jgi:dienelactone hydrolase
VVIENEGWELVGDLRLPSGRQPLAAVIMLNQAAGTRAAYSDLAEHLAERGLASLRLDLRGHGESTNLGEFVPGALSHDPLIWDAESDVAAAHRYLRSHHQLAGLRVGFVGASYSGEEMAESGRTHGYGDAYVLLSPGSLSEVSIGSMESSGVPWLFIATREDPFLRDISSAIQAEAGTVEVNIVPGAGHGTDMFLAQPGMAERIAVWLAHRLGPARAGR